MTNLTTTDNPTEPTPILDSSEVKDADQTQPVHHDLTVKRKRLVRQEATSLYVEAKDEVKAESEQQTNHTDTRTPDKGSTLSSRSDEKEADRSARESGKLNRKQSIQKHNHNRQKPAVETITATENKGEADGEHKRKQSTSVVTNQPKRDHNPCTHSHSSLRTGSLNTQPCSSNSAPCPAYSLDSWGEGQVWQLQGHRQAGTTVSQTTPGHVRTQQEQPGHNGTMTKTEHKRTQEGQHGTTTTPGHTRTQQGQSGPNGTTANTEHSRTKQGQYVALATITTPGHGRTQQGRTGPMGTLTTPGQGRTKQEQPCPTNTKTTPGHTISQEGQLGTTAAGQGKRRPTQHTHDNLSYQAIPPEFLTTNPRLEDKLRAQQQEHALYNEKLSRLSPLPADLPVAGWSVQSAHDLATPNCVLLTVGLLLIGMVIVMMVAMDRIDNNQ